MTHGLVAVALLLSAVPVQANEPADPDPPPAADAPADDEDFVQVPRDEWEAMQNRIANIESILGTDLQLGSALENLQADMDALKTSQAKSMQVTYGHGGLKFSNEDGEIKIGGRIQNDLTLASGDSDLNDSVGKLEDGMEIRRARVYVSGKWYDQVEFKAQYDFAGGDADFKDVYVRLKELPVVDNVTIGQQKEPFSLEEITSSNWVTFVERALPNVFSPGRSNGIQSTHTFNDKNGVISAGFFKDGSDDFGNASDDGSWAWTGRASYTPVYDSEAYRVVHLGASASTRSVDGDSLRFRQRPEAHNLQRLVDTGVFDADGVDLLGVEAAWVEGPFSLQGEIMQASVDSDATDDPTFDGHYIQASYFVTEGDHRTYEHGKAKFGRVKPEDSYITKGAEKGTGAVELALRYSYLDLSDRGINGGELEDWTYGVNWYLSRNQRVMLNYIDTELSESGDGDGSIFVMRYQIDF